VLIPRLCWFQVVYVRLTADEMSGLKPVLKVFGDFLEVFSKRYAGPRAADAPVAAAQKFGVLVVAQHGVTLRPARR